MDLGKFATRDNCEKGVWVEPIIFGQESGVEVCVLGSDADVVRKHASEMLREIQAMTKPQQERINFVERNREDVVVRTVGLRVKGDVEQKLPVTICDRVVEDTPAGYRFMYTEIPEMQKFVKDYSDTRANFLPEEKKSLNERSDDSST